MPEKLRMTAQRRVILEELRKLQTHPTAAELFSLVRRRLPRISLGTVYRNLDILSKHGLVQTMALGNGPLRYDADTDNHYHLCCLQCGRIEDIPPGMVDVRSSGLHQSSGYRILRHRLKFFGLCPRCRKETA